MASGKENSDQRPRWLRILLELAMQQKLCLWLVLVVLFGALALGNPFLPCGSATPAAIGSSSAGVGAAAAASPGLPPRAAEIVHPVAPAPAVADAQLAGAGSSRRDFGVPALAVAPSRRAAAVALRAGSAFDAALLSPSCPDPELAPLVVAVEELAVGTVWVLRDGRRFARNPVAGALPLLVPFGDGK